MIDWQNVITDLEEINDPIKMGDYVENIVFEILNKIFKSFRIEKKTGKLIDFIIDISVRSKSLDILCEIKYGSKQLISYWNYKVPLIHRELNRIQRKKKTKHLIIYIGQIGDYYKSDFSRIFSNIYNNIILIELKNLISIYNFFCKYPDRGLSLFNNIIEFSSGFLYEEFIDNLIYFTLNYYEYSIMMKELGFLISSINKRFLKINKSRLLKKYDILSTYKEDILEILIRAITNKKISINQIESKITCPIDTLKLIFQYLVEESKILIPLEYDTYEINKNFKTFLQSFNLIYQSNKNHLIVKFYTSNYFWGSLNEFYNKFLSRFYIVNLDNSQKDEFKKIISLFPKVLDYCLNNQTDIDFFLEISKSKFSNSFNDFKVKLFRQLIFDYFNNRDLISKIFLDRKILDERFLGNLVLLKENKQFLDFNIESKISQIKINSKAPIKAGTPISFKKPEMAINIVYKFIELKDYKDAIEKCDEFLNSDKLEHLRVPLLINQGVAYAYLSKFSKAIDNYEKALKIDEKPIIYKNLIHAWYNKYIHTVENQKEYPLLVEFLLDYLHNANVNLNKLKLLDISKDKDVNSDDIRELEFKIQGEFENFYKQFLKGVDENQIPRLLLTLRNYDLSYLNEIYNNNKSLIEKLYNKEYYELNSSSWNNLAVICLLLEKKNVALDLVNKAFKSLDEKINGIAYLDTKAEILMKLGRDVEALKYFLEILEINENNYKVKDFYAETCWKTATLYQKLGDSDNYQIYRKKAINLLDSHCKDDFIKKKIKDDFQL